MPTPELVSVRIEGGPHACCCQAYSNVTVIRCGNKGEETTYHKTDRKDAKGRPIYAPKKEQ